MWEGWDCGKGWGDLGGVPLSLQAGLGADFGTWRSWRWDPLADRGCFLHKPGTLQSCGSWLAEPPTDGVGWVQAVAKGSWVEVMWSCPMALRAGGDFMSPPRLSPHWLLPPACCSRSRWSWLRRGHRTRSAAADGPWKAAQRGEGGRCVWWFQHQLGPPAHCRALQCPSDGSLTLLRVFSFLVSPSSLLLSWRSPSPAGSR